MGRIRYRFYKELNDFIIPTLRNAEIISELNRKASVKDIIESYGVPHTEVGLILVNEISADFNYIVQDGDTICIYPSSECSEKKQLLKLRPEMSRTPKFVVDANLGRLARYLRLLGLIVCTAIIIAMLWLQQFRMRTNELYSPATVRYYSAKLLLSGILFGRRIPKLRFKKS